VPRRPDWLALALAVSAGAAEMLPLTACISWAVTLFGGEPSRAPGWQALAATWLVAFALARSVLAATRDPVWMRALAVLGWLAWTLGWWTGRAGELAAAGAFLPALVRLEAGALGLLLLSALIWWRALALASEPWPFQGDYLRWAVARDVVLLIGVTLAALASGGPAAQAVWAVLSWGAPLLVLLRLLTAALVQAQAVRRAYAGAVAAGPWVLRSLAVAAGALAVGALLSLLAGPAVWPHIARPVEWLLTLLVSVLVTVTVAFAVIVWTALRFVVWALRAIAGGGEPGPPPSLPTLPELTRPEQAARHLPIPPWVIDALAGLVGIALLAILILSLARAFRRYRALAEETAATERRERVSLGTVRDLLPRLRWPTRPAMRVRTFLRPTDVRSAYRAALMLLARQGVVRGPSETPSELAQRVVSAYPAIASPWIDLTARYLWSRYGERESQDDRQAALADWQELERTLSDQR